MDDCSRQEEAPWQAAGKEARPEKAESIWDRIPGQFFIEEEEKMLVDHIVPQKPWVLGAGAADATARQFQP